MHEKEKCRFVCFLLCHVLYLSRKCSWIFSPTDKHTVIRGKKFPGSDSLLGQGLSEWSFHFLLVSALVNSDYFLLQSKDKQVTLISDLKLAVSVNVSVSCCVSW